MVEIRLAKFPQSLFRSQNLGKTFVGFLCFWGFLGKLIGVQMKRMLLDSFFVDFIGDSITGFVCESRKC